MDDPWGIRRGAAAIAVDGGISVQDVSYETLRPKLDELGQKLVRAGYGKYSDQPRVWNSHKDWNAEKKGHECSFHIDKDTNGKISQRNMPTLKFNQK